MSMINMTTDALATGACVCMCARAEAVETRARQLHMHAHAHVHVHTHVHADVRAPLSARSATLHTCPTDRIDRNGCFIGYTIACLPVSPTRRAARLPTPAPQATRPPHARAPRANNAPAPLRGGAGSPPPLQPPRRATPRAHTLRPHHPPWEWGGVLRGRSLPAAPPPLKRNGEWGGTSTIPAVGAGFEESSSPPPAPKAPERGGESTAQAAPGPWSNPRGSLTGKPPRFYTLWSRPLGLGEGRTPNRQRYTRRDNPGGLVAGETPPQQGTLEKGVPLRDSSGVSSP